MWHSTDNLCFSYLLVCHDFSHVLYLPPRTISKGDSMRKYATGT